MEFPLSEIKDISSGPLTVGMVERTGPLHYTLLSGRCGEC